MPLFGLADEDGAHLFVKCKSIKDAWRAMHLERNRIELEQITTVHAMQDFLWDREEKTRVQILKFWWHWWNNRNKVREGELPIYVPELIRRVLSNTQEYLQLFSGKTKHTTVCKWQPPAQDRVKINLDGAFTPASHLCPGEQ